jgi:hypothetical protein
MREKTTARQGFNPCGCHPPQADLKKTNQNKPNSHHTDFRYLFSGNEAGKRFGQRPDSLNQKVSPAARQGKASGEKRF